jgi:hypothetical protein
MWLVIYCNSFIRLHILAGDIFQPFLSSWIRIRTNIVYLSDDATDSSGKEYWATQPVEAVSGQLLQLLKNISQKILDFPIFVKIFEKHLRKLSWTSQQDLAKNNYGSRKLLQKGKNY